MRLKEKILELFKEDPQEGFDNVAMEVFKYQSEANPVYKRYLSLLKYDVTQVQHYSDIPLMPISFYKHHEVKSGDWKTQKLFKSSGTGHSLRSLHHISETDWYDQVSLAILEESILGKAIGVGHRVEQGGRRRVGHWDGKGVEQEKRLVVLGLLPSYIENGDSSLVHMVQHFAQTCETPQPHFYLYNHKELASRIKDILSQTDDDILLFGVTFALLDFGIDCPIDSHRLKIVFTGGMKNRQAEMFTTEINQALKALFPSSLIASEYGMTEMLSQAYALEDGRYHMPSTLRIIPKEINDPLSTHKYNKTAIMGLIDLANVETLSFILTEDLGVIYPDNKFEVLGRLQVSDLRGCNLLYNPTEYK